MGKKALILVVDDSEGYRELLVSFLERHGFLFRPNAVVMVSN